MLSTKPVTSKLKIEVKAMDKLTPDVRGDLEFMPSVALLNRNALSICKVYRNYLGAVLKDGQEKGLQIDLANDVLARSFRKAMDCPNTWLPVINFWNNSVIAASVRSKDPAFASDYLKKLLKNLYMMFTSSDFKFNDTDPCQRFDNDPTVMEARRKLLTYYLENSLIDMQLKTENFRPPALSTQASFTPFNISELIEDEHDNGILEQLQSIRSNTTMKY